MLKTSNIATPPEVDRGSNPSPGTTTRRLPSVLGVERTNITRDDGVARQCALAGDALNDEQWGTDLPNPPSG